MLQRHDAMICWVDEIKLMKCSSYIENSKNSNMIFLEVGCYKIGPKSQFLVGANTSMYRGEITQSVTHLFSVSYRDPITRFIIGDGAHLVSNDDIPWLKCFHVESKPPTKKSW